MLIANHLRSRRRPSVSHHSRVAIQHLIQRHDSRAHSIARRARLPPKTWPRSGYRIDQPECAQFPCAPEPKKKPSSVTPSLRIVVNSTSLVGSSSKKSRVAFRSRIHRTHPSFRPPVRAFHRVVKSNKIFRIASLRTHRMATFRPRPRVPSMARRVVAILRFARRKAKSFVCPSDFEFFSNRDSSRVSRPSDTWWFYVVGKSRKRHALRIVVCFNAIQDVCIWFPPFCRFRMTNRRSVKSSLNQAGRVRQTATVSTEP